MAAPLVSFLIATYNRGPVLIECLRQVLRCGLPPSAFEILVVDNASTDATPDLLARELPEVRLIRLDKNRGPVAKNHALAQATGQWVVFLDDDAYPLPGAAAQMIRHFRQDPTLGAAVFDVTLPDGTREASAYPDVFIGAGTGFRRDLITRLGGLPQDFFMQAEEYDLSFRLLAAGYRVRRFADLPLLHLKAPGARIAERTTRLDVRNNLYLLARYVPAPLCHQLAADWLFRYWLMAQDRDARSAASPVPNAHKAAFLTGAAEGFARWSDQRKGGRRLLPDSVLETIFKFRTIRERLAAAQAAHGFRRIILADLGKNVLAYHRAARELGLEVLAIADDALAGSSGPPRCYRDVPLLGWPEASRLAFEAVVVSNLSPVHAPRRALALRRTLKVPVLDLFEAPGRVSSRLS